MQKKLVEGTEERIIGLEIYRELLRDEIKRVNNSFEKTLLKITELEKTISKANKEIDFLKESRTISENKKKKNQEIIKILDGIKGTKTLLREGLSKEAIGKTFYFFLRSSARRKMFNAEKLVLSFDDFFKLIMPYRQNPPIEENELALYSCSVCEKTHPVILELSVCQPSEETGKSPFFIINLLITCYKGGVFLISPNCGLILNDLS